MIYTKNISGEINQHANKLEDNMKKIFVVFLFIMVLSPISVFSVIAFNDIKDGFSNGDEIEDSIIQGSTEFLKCASDIYSFFSQYEQSERIALNLDVSKNAIESAIKNLEIGISHYEAAINIGKSAEYNQTNIDKLQSFNYSEFIVNEKMIPEIAYEVRFYLSKGDLIGIYNKNISNLKLILDKLNFINDSLKNNIKPDRQVIWKLLSDLSKSILFGNYSTRLALEILK